MITFYFPKHNGPTVLVKYVDLNITISSKYFRLYYIMLINDRLIMLIGLLIEEYNSKSKHQSLFCMFIFE